MRVQFDKSSNLGVILLFATWLLELILLCSSLNKKLPVTSHACSENKGCNLIF